MITDSSGQPSEFICCWYLPGFFELQVSNQNSYLACERFIGFHVHDHVGKYVTTGHPCCNAVVILLSSGSDSGGNAVSGRWSGLDNKCLGVKGCGGRLCWRGLRVVWQCLVWKYECLGLLPWTQDSKCIFLADQQTTPLELLPPLDLMDQYCELKLSMV